MQNTSADMIHAIKANTEAFMAISRIALSSIEQLTTLNLSTTRISLEEGAAAAVSMIEQNGAAPSANTKKATSIAASERTANYFRCVQDIASEAQEETTKLINAYLSSQGDGTGHQAGWIKGFDVFNGYGQQLSAFTEANRRVMANVTSRVVNKTNQHSRTSA
jgi:hypothetical protein